MTHCPWFPRLWGPRLQIFLQVAVGPDRIPRSTKSQLLFVGSPKRPHALIQSKWLWFLGTTLWNFRHCGNEGEKWMVILLVKRMFGCSSNHAVMWLLLCPVITASLSSNYRNLLKACKCWMWRVDFLSFSFEATFLEVTNVLFHLNVILFWTSIGHRPSC